MITARRLAAGICLILLLQFAPGCATEPGQTTPFPTLTPYPPDLYVGLSDTAGPLGDLVSPAYEAATGRPAPIFLQGNDETLLNDVQDGVLEAVLVHHLPAGSPFWFSPVALDGVVFVAHPDLPVADLSAGQFQAILGGSIGNWAEVGGPDLPIVLFSREAGSGAWEILRQRVLANVPLSGSALIAPSDAYLMQEVGSTPGAVGYTMMGAGGEDTILVGGFRATPDSVADQSYPLTTPIYFVSRTEPQGRMRDLLAWLQSDEGQSVLGEKYGRVR